MQNYYNSMPRYPLPQNQIQPQTMMLSLKGRPVTSLEEVRAAAVDFDGTVSFFPDLANGKIYTKQCNMDGTASLNMYELREIPAEMAPNNQNFVTRSEFNQAMAAIKEALSPKTNIEQQTVVQASPTTVKNETPEFNF